MKYIIFKIIPIIIIVIALVTYGITRYNSVENDIDRTLREDIMEWFSTFNPNENKSASDKDFIIKNMKTKYDLSDHWEFRQKTMELKKLNISAFFITIVTMFQDNKTSEYFLAKEYYYYDLDETSPIILKEETTKYKQGGDSIPVSTTKLWEGDFDSYCVKPAE